MSAADIVELIGGMAGIITAIVLGLRYRAAAQSQERKDQLEAGRLALELANGLKSEMDCLKKKADQQDSDIEMLQNNNIELKSEVETLRQENEALKNEIVVLRHENASLKLEVEQLRAENVELKEENQDLRDRLEVVENRKVKPGNSK